MQAAPASPPRTALVTGATDGIGLALARRLDRQGLRLVLLGRRPLASVDAALAARHVTVVADLAQPHAARAAVEQALAAAGIERLDLLVHNAAVGSFVALEREPAARLLEQLAVDLEAPLLLTQALLPRLRAARGRVVLVSSVAAQLACPDFAAYSAMKRALEGFGRALRLEERGAVEVRVVAPGGTRTDIHVKSGAPAAEVARLARRWPSADEVAVALDRAAHGRHWRCTLGRTNALGAWLGRHLPRLADRALGRARPWQPPCTPPAPAAAPGAPRRALVTGAADGIGLALAQQLLAQGWQVEGVDVDGARMAALPAVHWHACDLADAGAVERLGATLAAGAPFDLVVHNAGISATGRFATQDPALWQRVLAVNLAAPLALTPVLLAAGRVRAGGTLAFVSSLSHQVGYPGAAAYAASKDGLASYARSVRMAVRGRGLHVLVACPGPTRTAHARRHAPPASDESRRMPPQRVAAALLAGVRARRALVVPGLSSRAAAWLGEWLPAITDRILVRTILERLP
ncbi:MAG: SDR family NAD(P)-dependent oxidoreductase [Planctomycetia bacterium]